MSGFLGTSFEKFVFASHLLYISQKYAMKSLIHAKLSPARRYLAMTVNWHRYAGRLKNRSCSALMSSLLHDLTLQMNSICVHLYGYDHAEISAEARRYHQTCLLVESQLGHLQTSDHPETPCVAEIYPPEGVPHFSLLFFPHLYEK